MRSLFLGFLLAVALPVLAADEDDWGALPSAPLPPAAPAAPGSGSAAAGSAPAPAGSAPSARAISSATARQAQLLKLRANGLYRARKYREARDLYAACARLDPGDADARNDLAGCYLKLGRGDSALAWARAALRAADAGLAASDTAAWSFPDLRARKNAYFLLDKVGAPMPVPEPGRCETWIAPDAGCRAPLRVCAERGSRPAEGGTLRWDILRAGVSELKALFTYEEVESPSQIARPELRDMEAQSIDGISESESRWRNRDSAATLPLGEFLETVDPACSGPACGSLEKELTACRVLHFDACAGVIGMACASREDGGSDRVVVGEWYLLPAR